MTKIVRIGVGSVGALLALLAFTPSIVDIGMPMDNFGIILGSILAIILFVWALVTGKLKKIANDLNHILTLDSFKGIGIGIVLTVAYAIILGLVFLWLKPWMQMELQIDPRITSTVAIVAGLVAATPLIALFRATGLPFDRNNLTYATSLLALVVVAVTSYATHEQPNAFFSIDGVSQFMVADGENRFFFIEPEDCKKMKNGCTSPLGEELRPGTPADARKYEKISWLKEAAEDATEAARKEAEKAHKKEATFIPSNRTGKWLALIKPGKGIGNFCISRGNKVRFEREKGVGATLTYVVILDGDKAEHVFHQVQGKELPKLSDNARCIRSITTTEEIAMRITISLKKS